MRLAALLLVAWGFLAALTGDSFTPGRLGIYVAPVLMLAAGGLAFVAVLLRAWHAAAGAALVALGLLAIFSAQLTRAAPERPVVGVPAAITILSHSLRSSDPEHFIRAHPADIIALQEVEDAEALIGRLADLYAPQGAALHHCRRDRELVLSRFPVAEPDPRSRRWWLLCRVTLPGGEVLASSVHLPKAMFHRVGRQRDLFAELAAVVAGETLPLILMGDFNTTPLTTPYRMISARLSSAHAAAGRGMGVTFPTRARPLLGLAGPFLAIDHVFTSAHFEVREAEVLSDHAEGADHYPVRAVLALVRN